MIWLKANTFQIRRLHVSTMVRNEKWDRLGEMVAQLMKKTGVPGVCVGILHQGETATAGFGVTSAEHPLPVTDETLFQIGSITKTFTGTALMRLVEAGQVDLEATVRTYLPDFKVSDEAAASHVTVRHLLTHMGGWEGDYFHDTGAGDDALARYVADMGGLKQLAPLGTVWSYNNAAFSVAGRIIEVVTGKTYEAALKELVLQPLGLQHSFLDPGDLITHRFVVGHHVADEGAQVARPWPLPRSAYPAGGIVCDVRDLLRYARFHLGDGRVEGETRLLSAETMAAMQSPQAAVWGKETWGLSWSVDDTYGTCLVSHGGGTNGQSTMLQLVPEHEFALVVLTNADRGGTVIQKLGQWVLKQYLGLEVPDPTPIEASVEDLAAYAGLYSRPAADVELGLLGGRLIAQLIFRIHFPTEDSPPPPPPRPACEKDRLFALDGEAKGEKADILRKPDGSIGWLRSGGRIHVRQT
jgi:CubicO group peptidase (beta-lactamase class C family)